MTTGRRHRVAVTSGDLTRRAIVFVPASVSPGSAPPLVLTLHGSGSGAVEQLALSGLEATGERHGFVVVAPQGAIRAGAGHAWNVPHVTTAPGAPDDEAFLCALVDALVAGGYADRRRVFATGLSGGGRMVSQLAADHPEVLAAIAPVAGLRAGAPLASEPRRPDPATCAPRSPVPVVAFHGTADPVNPFDGGGEPYWGYSVLTALARWAELNGCAAEPTEDHLTEHVSTLAYGPPGEAATTVLYVVEGGGHTWPGSAYPFPADVGAVSREIDAGEAMWAFFATHRPADHP